MSVYKINIAGCERELPICPINEHMDIAGFVMFSDVEITEAVAKALLEKCPEHDIIVTAESKGIPLAYEMARIGCRNYVVARKGIKAYMEDPIHVEVKSITTAHVQKLYLSKADCENLRGKRDFHWRVFGRHGRAFAFHRRTGGGEGLCSGGGRREGPGRYYILRAPAPVL